MNERDLGDGTGGTFLAGGVGALLACCAVHFLVIAGVIAGMSGLAFGGLALAIGTAIAALADRSGDERVAVMYAGDEPDAKQTVATLIGDLNFVPDAAPVAGGRLLAMRPPAAAITDVRMRQWEEVAVPLHESTPAL